MSVKKGFDTERDVMRNTLQWLVMHLHRELINFIGNLRLAAFAGYDVKENTQQVGLYRGLLLGPTSQLQLFPLERSLHHSGVDGLIKIYLLVVVKQAPS